MSKVAFKQVDLQRALRAAKAVGFEHPSVEILPDGTLRLLTAPQAPTADAGDEAGAFWDGWDQGDGRP